MIAVYFGLRVQVMTYPFDGVIQLGQLGIPLTVLWIIGVTNAVNLIDGLDGLAAGVSGIAAITIGIVAFRGDQMMIAFLALVMAGAVLGFLPHNFHPARLFMGDSGAMFLGFVLSCLSVSGMAKSAAIISLGVPVVILGIPVFDTLFAIVRRVSNKTNIFGADKAHLHHRLMAMGCSHEKAVLIIYLISIVLGAAAVVMTYVTSPKATLILAVLLVAIIVGGSRIGIVSGKPQKEKAEVYIKREGVSGGM
jgi:UDP-GlcNAc:undecaprenyl-phosphate GlcNAc-1-phosphate transferase